MGEGAAFHPPSPPQRASSRRKPRPLESLSIEFTELLASNNSLGESSNFWSNPTCQADVSLEAEVEDSDEARVENSEEAAESSGAGEPSELARREQEEQEEPVPWQKPRPQGFAFPVQASTSLPWSFPMLDPSPVFTVMFASQHMDPDEIGFGPLPPPSTSRLYVSSPRTRPGRILTGLSGSRGGGSRLSSAMSRPRAASKSSRLSKGSQGSIAYSKASSLYTTRSGSSRPATARLAKKKQQPLSPGQESWANAPVMLQDHPAIPVPPEIRAKAQKPLARELGLLAVGLSSALLAKRPMRGVVVSCLGDVFQHVDRRGTGLAEWHKLVSALTQLGVGLRTAEFEALGRYFCGEYETRVSLPQLRAELLGHGLERTIAGRRRGVEEEVTPTPE